MEQIYNRIALWNSRRYDREYDAELAFNLIKEELQEYLDAETEVDRLDALCDITYVAMGMHWKANLSMQTLHETEQDALINAQHLMLDADRCGESIIALTLQELSKASFENVGILIAYTTNSLLAICALAARDYLRLTQQQFKDAMLVVCDSNDSKSVTKTASNVKANKDKGQYFIPPEHRLQIILDSREVLDA